MPVQPIRLFGDPVLRTPAEPVVDFDKELRTLVKDLHRHHARRPRRRAWRRRRSGSACGSSPTTSTTSSGTSSTRPSTSPTRSRTDDEGCLSFPGLAFPTMRAYGVVAKGFDMYGEPVTIEGTELLARCVQHETDHLDGILFIDRLDQAQRKAALKAIREAEWAGETAPPVKLSPARDLPAERSEPPRCASSSPAPPRSPSRRWTPCSPRATRSSPSLTRPDAPAGRGRTAGRVAGGASAPRRPASRC